MTLLLIIVFSLKLGGQLRERVGARIGAKVTSNVIEGNFPQYDATTELPSIEVGRGN